MDQLHTANKVCGGCCAISLNTVDTESSVSPIGKSGIYLQEDGEQAKSFWCFRVHESEVKHLRGLGR